MKSIILTAMAALFYTAAGAQTPADYTPSTDRQSEEEHPLPAYTSDVMMTRDGGILQIKFFGHGSVGFTHILERHHREADGSVRVHYDENVVYVDPVPEYVDLTKLPDPDVILFTHEHGDHLNTKGIERFSNSLDGYIAVTDRPTIIWGNPTAVDKLDKEGLAGGVIRHGEVRKFGPNPLATELRFSDFSGSSDDTYSDYPTPVWMTVEAIPAYNTSPEKANFHPRERAHNGYILTFGGTRVYVAGDTEPTPEMLALKNIDVAFLPVNLPYTMTEEQAAEAVRAIRPRVFYPYHFGGTGHKTDLEKLGRLIEGLGVEMRVRPLE